MRLRELISGMLRWHTLATIANNEISKLVGLVPIIGYLILYNDFFAEQFSFSKVLGTQGAQNLFVFDAAPKLHLTFFGCVFVFISNVIFRTACPRVIQNHPSDIDFSDRVLNSYSAWEIHSLEGDVRELTEFKTPFVKEYASDPRISESQLLGYSRKPPMIDEYAEYISALSREWWVQNDCRNPLIRRMCLLSGIFGYLMLSLPTLDITQAVSRKIFLDFLSASHTLM